MALKGTHIFAMILAGGVLLWILSGVVFPSSPHAPAEAEEAAAPKGGGQAVRVLAEKREAVTHRRQLIVYGVTEAAQNVALKAEISGKVDAIVAAEGSRLAKGAPILKLELRGKQEQLREAKATLRQRELEYQAAKKLEKHGFRGELRVVESKARLEQARANLQFARDALAHTTIRAPFDGTLDQLMVDAGDVVVGGMGPGMGNDTVGVFVTLDPMLAVAQVTEGDRAHVAPEQRVTVTMGDGSTHEGTVRFVSSVAQPETRTYRVEISLPNAERRIAEGATARIRIPVKAYQAYHVSPAILALDDAGRIGVKTLDEENRVGFRPVTIVDDTGNEGVWIAGLPERVTLLTDGQAFISPGQIINPVFLEHTPANAEVTDGNAVGP